MSKDVSDALFEALKVDYLRLERAAMAHCIRRAQRRAMQMQIVVPSFGVLRKRLRRFCKANEDTVILAREGREALVARCLDPQAARDHAAKQRAFMAQTARAFTAAAHSKPLNAAFRADERVPDAVLRFVGGKLFDGMSLTHAQLSDIVALATAVAAGALDLTLLHSLRTDFGDISGIGAR